MDIHYDITDRRDDMLSFQYWIHKTNTAADESSIVAWHWFGVELELLPSLVETIAELSIELKGA